MPTDYVFWRDLENQFRELLGPIRLEATWYGGDSRWSRISINGPRDGPRDERKRKQLLILFEACAESAARAAGAPDTVEGWLDRLREESPHFRVFSAARKDDEGGWIQDLALASADYCPVCRNRAERSTAWRDHQAQFEMYAGQYPELRAIWRAAFAKWVFWNGSAPARREHQQGEDVFKAIAHKAAAGLSHLSVAGDGEPWCVWLGSMRQRGWGFRVTGNVGTKGGKPVEFVSKELPEGAAAETELTVADDWLEDGEIEQVFASSARFCEELAAHGEIAPKAADGETAAVPDGHTTEIPEQQIPPEVCAPTAPEGVGPDINERKAERKKLRDDYKAECKRAGVKVTDVIIAEAANPTTPNNKGWHSRSNIQKWLACDPKYEGTPDQRIRNVFLKKPHLSDPHA